MFHIAPAERVANPKTRRLINLFYFLLTCRVLQRTLWGLRKEQPRAPNFPPWLLLGLPFALLLIMEEAKNPRFRQVYKELEFYERHDKWEEKGSRLIVAGEPKVR